MRGPELFIPCDGCNHSDWCRNRGCTVWNDESRHRFERAKIRSKEINDEIDKLEAEFGSLNSDLD